MANQRRFEKPIIRWAGSKRKLVPLLLDNVPSTFDRYVEPFCGSACLFFSLKPKSALLSDINEELVNALNFLKSSRDARKELLKLPNTKEEYYRIRAINPSTLSNSGRAIRFLYLNRYCFNGVYRTNKQGKFNVPRGTKTGGIPSSEVFDLAYETLKCAEISSNDYKQTLSKLVEGDFAYIDPPYTKLGKFTGEYGLGSFDEGNIEEFCEELRKLNSRGVKFLFSYRESDLLSKLLGKSFQSKNIPVKRHVSGFKTSWQESSEVLIKNYE
ncbi:Dam family site-specific DNA-(adenine-N6)-methyltransferase [Marinobacter sp. NFXS9]|uniref:DNA adenine methylase n=1 Tax=Marinobacter sp. NFXS9 TaxID=2818433 RepID=UPI0032DE7D88